MLVVEDLKKAIQNRDAKKIADIVTKFNLTISNGKITADNLLINKFTAFWDKRQLVKKINLNSLKCRARLPVMAK